MTHRDFTKDLKFKRGDHWGVYLVSGGGLYYDLNPGPANKYCTGNESLRPEINDIITLKETPLGDELSIKVTYWLNVCGKKSYDIYS